MIIVFTLIVLLIDIISKLVVSHSLYLGESVKIINNFLNITYVKNTGAAWSILADKSFVVVFISAVIIMVIIGYIYRHKPNVLLEKIAYSLVLGGAIGNFIDRIFYGYVIDFIDVSIFGYDYPIFNLADCFIVIGVVLIVIATWRCSNGNKGRK